jgi:hypothetical protein
MRYPFRALALACALTLTPACAALHLSAPNPISVAQTNDQRAYAVIESYGALVETATIMVRDPSMPIEAKRAIGRAEAVATPSVQTLEVAFSAYLRARASYEAASHSDDNAMTRAANALNAAAQVLGQAIGRAQARVAELQSLINTQRGTAR